MDEKQHPDQQKSRADAPKNTPDGRPSKARRVMSKRWLYPAIYLGAAAVIIGLMYARSQMGASPTSVKPVANNQSTNATQTSKTATQPHEPFVWPVSDGVKPQVSVGFFPTKGSAKAQEAALVEYDNTYYPHKGIDIKSKNGQAFQVTSALSGKVIAADNQPLYGQEVVIQSAAGYTETYQSLDSVNVKKGAMVHQGEVLGTTGSNAFEKGQGNHLYFQVDYQGAPIDPESVLPKQ